MDTKSVITGLMPILKKYADVIEQFTGDEKAASVSQDIAQAADVVNAIASLVDSFAHGVPVTEDDARISLGGMDQALDAFDAEIQKQGGRP